MEDPPSNEVYFHADFAENIPIPLAHSQTSDMFHGSQRKTLSIFGAYIIQRDDRRSPRKLAVVLVGDVIEKSAAYANACIRRALTFVKGLGRLDALRFCFDSGNHFRSYESSHLLFHEVPLQYRQRAVTHYLVEKHGKGPDDAEIFARIRMWLKEYLLQEDAFIDTEQKLVSVLAAAAAREVRENKDGLQFHIEVFQPADRPTKKNELAFADHITRSYCWESIPGVRRGAPTLELRNWIFSDATAFTPVAYSVQQSDVAADAGDWRRGYWSDATWRKGPLELTEHNEITRRFTEQLSDATKTTLVAARSDDFASLVQRDERRLSKAKERQKRKRAQRGA